MKKYLSRIIPAAVLIIATVALVFYEISIFNDYVVSTVSKAIAIEKEITTALSELQDSFIISSPSETDMAVNTPVVTFSGMCDINNPLTICGNAVEIAQDGSFSYDVQLQPGVNNIMVANSVKTAEYHITYNTLVINSVSPDKNLSADGGMVLEVSAEALTGSEVFAIINGTTVYMTAGDENGQFTNYYGNYTIPSASSTSRSIGKIVFYAKYGDFTDSKTGGKITINPYSALDVLIERGQGSVVAPEITGGDVVNVLSPDNDHGRGRARMCMVNADYAETVPANTADDKSDPNYTPEIKGTVDYITSEATYDGMDYYILLSGTKVEKKNVTTLDGYVMPTNTISSYKSYTSDGYTNAILTMNWKVPFNSVLKEQNYYRGYSGRMFNVSSFTASYIDFTFKYTNAADGGFDFSSSNVVSSAQWVNIGTDGTTTLRVFLRNAGKFYGYRTYYSNDNRLVISFNEKPTTSSAVVVLDPGHGGRDCGAIGVNGTYESSINFRIAARVKSNLEAAGIRVVILRTNDSYYSLDERQSMARKAGGDIFVALHNNSSTSQSLSGTEVYYYRAYSKSLASDIHSCLASAWRSVYAGNQAMQNKVVADDGGVRFYPFRVTRLEECPAVLVECGYLSNPTECSMLCTDSVQTQLADAVSRGIINYFNKQ